MQTVPTRSLVPGMVVAADVVDREGNKLMDAGAVIEAKTAARLASRGVTRVRVTDESYGLSAMVAAVEEDGRVEGGTGRIEKQSAIEPEEVSRLSKPDTSIVQERLLRLAHMFNEYRDDQLMRELCRLAIKCAQERLMSV